MSWSHRNLISIESLSYQDIEYVLNTAKDAQLGKFNHVLSNKIIASCFFEASTRTRMSFETAIYRMNGNVIGFADSINTSEKKGESLEDTIRMIDSYADAIVIRHPKSGSAEIAKNIASIPVINAGDGDNQHPSQTLLDLYTIKQKFSKINGISIAMMGDLKHGRTIHSLCQALALYKDITIYLLSSEMLKLPDNIKSQIKNKVILIEIDDIKEAIDKIDVLYVTRLQKERFLDHSSYCDYPKITRESLIGAKEDMIVLHPLPRVDELDAAVDSTPHAWYFKQAKNGVYVRQAILRTLMGCHYGL